MTKQLLIILYLWNNALVFINKGIRQVYEWQFTYHFPKQNKNKNLKEKILDFVSI